MRSAEASMLEALRRIQAFLDLRASQFGGITQGGAKKRLADAITALDDYAAANVGGIIVAKDLTGKQASQRAALLRDHMASIAAIAKADLPRVPELSDLRMPRTRLTGERLAGAAVRMAKAAELHAPVFIAAGLPENFIAELTSAAADLVTTVSERATTRSVARGAATGLKAHLTEARKVVAILDAFMKTALKDDPALLEQWKLLKRVPRTISSTPTPSAAPNPAPASPVETPSPSAAAATA